MMVLGEAQLVLGRQRRVDLLQRLYEQVALKQLLADPQRHRLAERGEAARREGEVGLDQPLELEERLLVEDDLVDRRAVAARGLQAIAQRMRRKPGVVLDAGEALLLRRGDDRPVLDDRSRAVVIERGQPEDAHASIPRPL